MQSVSIIDDRTTLRSPDNRNPRRSANLDLVRRAERVLRLGFHPEGDPWRGSPSDASRLSECLQAMRFHLSTDPRLQ